MMSKLNIDTWKLSKLTSFTWNLIHINVVHGRRIWDIYVKTDIEHAERKTEGKKSL